MANFVIGVIVSIGPLQNLTSKKSGNAFKKRDVVLMLRRFDPYTGEPLTDTENTPQLSFMNDLCNELDKFVPGQLVTVYFNIQGTKYTDQSNVTKIINDIRPYRIELYQPKSFVSPQTFGYPAPPNNVPQNPPIGSSGPHYPQQSTQSPEPAPGYGQQPPFGGSQQPLPPSSHQNGGGYKAPF